MADSRSASRRSFLKKLAAASVATAASAPFVRPSRSEILELPSRQTKPVSPNDTIRVASIGMGIIAFYNLPSMLRVPGVELVAAADCYEGRLTRTREIFGDHVDTTRDYRELLERDDIDAVFIHTPDHWHERIAVDAMRAGKAVHVEKPMVQDLDEGHRMIAAQEETGQILQAGSESVTSIGTRKARELFQSGAIGELNMVDALIARNSAIGAWQYAIPPDASPETIDWDMFLGDAPDRAFDLDRFFRWRKYWDYGTGVAGDLFVHRFSALHRIIDGLGPTQAMAMGGVYHWNDGREAPDVMLALYDYPETASHPAFSMSMKVNFAAGDSESYFRLIGTEGTMHVQGNNVMLTSRRGGDQPSPDEMRGWPSLRTFSQAQQDAFIEDYLKYQNEALRPGSQSGASIEYQAPEGYSSTFDQYTRFFDAMRMGGPIVQDVTFGYRAAAAAILANHSYRDDRAYAWNPVDMEIRGANPSTASAN
ncbi:MAG: Gfo/Idh/MocA family oxidoreductase [Rhodothermales bacterium]